MYRRTLAAAIVVVAGLLGASCEELPNIAPTAAFVFSPVAPIYAGTTLVTFNAVGSRDADGRLDSYLWDFGDGTGEQASGGATITHTFPDTPARCLTITYTVLLTTVDDQGEGDTASKTIDVIEAPDPGSAGCR